MKKNLINLRRWIPFVAFLLFFCCASAQQALEKFKDTNGKHGFKNKLGTIVIPAKYQDAGYFKDGLAYVQLNNKWGFIDEQGHEVVPLKYDKLGYDFSKVYKEGLLRVQLNDKWGFIDKKGKEVVPIKYEELDEFHEGMAGVQLNNKWGFVDKTGKEVIEPKYDFPELFDEEDYFGYFFTEGMAVVYLKGKYGFVDKKGKEVVPIKYNYVEPFKNGFAQVTTNRKWGFVNKTGKEVIAVKYESVNDFAEGIAVIKFNDKYGFVNATGKEIVPVKYDHVRDFSEGLAAVALEEKWGFIDKTGKEVIPLQYNYVHRHFSKGKALVAKDGQNDFWIDNTGMPIDNKELSNATASPQKPPETKTTVKTETQTNTTQIKTTVSPAGMKGIIDPSLVGTWKYHDDPANFNGFYILRADGTYDYWTDMMTPTAPPPNYKNFWRVDGDVIEFLYEGGEKVSHTKFLKRNDPQTNRPALVIEWNNSGYYRTYFPTDAKALWNITTTTNKPAENKTVVPVKLVEPPVKLNGEVDLSIVGLWKITHSKIDYYLDYKADGTYETWSSDNTKKLKHFWRIDNGFMEVLYEGRKQPERFSFKKVNALATGKPAISLKNFIYFPEIDREMWK